MKDYKLATKMYMKEGRDGYQMLINCEALIDEEDGPLLFAIVENHFEGVEMMSKHANLNTHHRPSLVPQYIRSSLIKDIMFSDHSPAANGKDVNSNDLTFDFNRKLSLQQGLTTLTPNRLRLPQIRERKLSLQQSLNLSQEAMTRIKNSDEYIKKLTEYEKKSLKLCPELEGRIVCIKNQQVNAIIAIEF